ncbi:Hypothetical protein D9617_64g101330 [Elsinoe fawcettii]|nr:Hypothetical protein D9617_64g101330 [Elsinoe fawcettii]
MSEFGGCYGQGKIRGREYPELLFTIAYDIANHGWDLIAATTQAKLNSQLDKIHNISVQRTTTIKIGPIPVQVSLDAVISAPQLHVRKGSGHIVDVRIPIAGKVMIAGEDTIFPDKEFFTLTTDLVHVEAELQPHPEEQKKSYDLIINMENQDAVVDMSMDIPSETLSFLVQLLKEVVTKDIGNGHRYRVTTFDLDDDQTGDYKPLIPRVADFSFVQDDANVDRSNLLVLMNSVTTTRGELFFNAPLLPPGEDFMLLVSNHIFLETYVQPPLAKLKEKVKQPEKLIEKIEMIKIDSVKDFWQIRNKSDIPLSVEHDPWISTLNASIDPNEEALMFYIDAKADVTFLDIRIDIWQKIWQQFTFDGQGNVTTKQVKEESGKSQEMAWWKWLLSVLFGLIALLVVGIINAVVQDNVNGMDLPFKDIGAVAVRWPNQKGAKLKGIRSPGHVVLSMDVEFD